jgi:prepilin-type N-terminal cleavage/methylation domain
MKLGNAVRRKLKEKGGFTLTELLLTTLILLMVAAVVAGGVPAAANAYFKVVDASNAQILLSTTVTELRTELALATSVKPDSDNPKSVIYTNGSSGWQKRLSNSTDKGIVTEEIAVTGEKTMGSQPLVPEALSGVIRGGTPMVSSFDEIKYDKDTGIFTISKLQVKKGNQVLAEVGEMTIRNIMPKLSGQQEG